MNDLKSLGKTTPDPAAAKKQPWLWLVFAFLVFAGLALTLLGFWRDYTLVIDGKAYQTKALVFRAGTLLKHAGLEMGKDDQVSTDLEKFSFSLPKTVTIQRARKITVLTDSKIQHLNTTETYPINILELAGIKLFPNDLILQNEQVIDPLKPLALGQEHILEYRPAKLVMLNDHNQRSYFSSQAETLAEALEERDIKVGEYDRLSLPLETILNPTTELDIRRARQVVAMLGDKTLNGYSAAEDFEEVLLDIGLPVQNLNYVAGGQDNQGQKIDGNQPIKIVQVIESQEWIKEETPYSNTYESDPNAELDTVSVLVPGQTGYVVTRNITRLEDGEIVKTYPSQHWKASDPIDGVLGRGTLPVVKTEDVDGVTLEYWRKVSVYATSYKPSSFPPDARTRSGTPVMKGVIAVSAAWYPSMAGQRVYVPGYGFAVIGDSGRGIAGRYWIDLGYDDASYVGWHHWTTLYFLTPIPAYIPAVLP